MIALKVDVEHVLAGLPSRLREVAHSLSQFSVTETCARTGRSRSGVYKSIRKLRRAFIAAGVPWPTPCGHGEPAVEKVPRWPARKESVVLKEKTINGRRRLMKVNNKRADEYRDAGHRVVALRVGQHWKGGISARGVSSLWALQSPFSLAVSPRMSTWEGTELWNRPYNRRAFNHEGHLFFQTKR